MTYNTFLLSARKSQTKRFAELKPRSVSSRALIRAVMPEAGKHSLWISDHPNITGELLRSIHWPTRQIGRAVLLFVPKAETLVTLRTCFDRVAFGLPASFLQGEELAAALAAENARDLFIGGTVDQASQTLTLWRGNLESLVVPFSAFQASGDGMQPDFGHLSIADYGQTIRLGEYEAATDAMLYEHDSEYRRRKLKQRIASERTLGAAVRRLRKQRGLRRDDFAPLAEKTIARIERGEVKRLHPRTRATLAKRLQVAPNAIESY